MLYVATMGSFLHHLFFGQESVGDAHSYLTCPIQSAAQYTPKPRERSLLGQEELVDHAVRLAMDHKVSFGRRKGIRLYRQVKGYRRGLRRIYQTLSGFAEEGHSIATGSEWIIDNYYLLEDHLDEILQYLADHLDRPLPKLLSGPYKDYPRIYRLAMELIETSDSLVDPDLIDHFIRGYQSQKPLDMRELWAFPILLRVALIRNIYHLGCVNQVTLQQRVQAENLVKRLFEEKANASDPLTALATEIERDKELWSTGCHVHLVQALRAQGMKASACVQWLDNKMAEHKCPCDQAIRTVRQAHAANQVSIANSFESLRMITRRDWKQWFEDFSYVHKALLNDPAQVYEKSDFQTRDRYRWRIERIADSIGMKDLGVAEAAVCLAEKEASKGDLYAHVGYYLIDKGECLFDQDLDTKPSLARRIRRLSQYSTPFAVWGAAQVVTTLVLLAVPIAVLYSFAVAVPLILLVALFFIPLVSEAALQALQWGGAHFTTPSLLPKMDYEEGIPDEHRTLVTCHAVLNNRSATMAAVDFLETRALDNRDPNLYFCLFCDLSQSKNAVEPDDCKLIGLAARMVQKLNERHSREWPQRFFLITRGRKWSETEGLFLGWERKRGKIHQLNQLILTGESKHLKVEVGQREFFSTIRYVITLDDDTRIPPGVASQMVGALAHPLNRPLFIGKSQKVKRGYTIVQPRLETAFLAGNRSRFSRVFSAVGGLDPYTRLVSDFNQDLFAHGSYYGKGIYDVAAFERALKGWMPEERILSHDLLEGFFVRVGFSGDLPLIDDFPSNPVSYIKRLHRWVRGDWQLLPWMFPRVRNGGGKFVPTPLNFSERWRLLDNLRRSLLAPAALISFTAAWTILPGSTLLWELGIILCMAVSALTTVIDMLMQPLFDLRRARQIPVLMVRITRLLRQFLVELALLPYFAYQMIHAIILTLYRLFISRKQLLQWRTASFVEERTSISLSGFSLEMLPALCITLALMGLVVVVAPARALHALPFILLWMSSPILAVYLSTPLRRLEAKPSKQQKEALLDIAWDTWRFFDESIGEQTHNLVPDNIQMVPEPKVAMRTSPTNIGLQLLSTLSAYDLGFLMAPEAIRRIKACFMTLSRMDKLRGHFYNWYDIETLKPLFPFYISTVDSGNLISHLITLRSALLQLPSDPVICDAHLEASRRRGEKVVACNTFKNLITGYESLTTFLDVLSKESDPLVVDRYQRICEEKERLDLKSPSWKDLKEICVTILELLRQLPEQPGVIELSRQLREIQSISEGLIQNSALLAAQTDQMIAAMDFRFLYSNEENLLSIGYTAETDKLDQHFYGLISSEAMVTSLVSIAKGDVPTKHWFSLGRPLVRAGGKKALLSWTGSMFEYLMPHLVVKSFPESLLTQSSSAAVREQQMYGETRSLPWGVSESAFAATDLEGTYQYRAFGAPALGLKRGLADDYVVAPYASFLALHVDPEAAWENIQRLKGVGAASKYGFCEAIDYTPARLSENESSYRVQAHFSHHQGMIMGSINNFLNGNILQKRFHSDPYIRSVTLLLQETLPPYAETVTLHRPKVLARPKAEELVPLTRRFDTPHTLFPHTHLISNGSFSQMIDNTGGGFLSFERNLALTNWAEDFLQNQTGIYIFVRDLESGKVWSMGYQPTRVEPDTYEVTFSPEKVEFRRSDFNIGLHAEITLSPEDNVEVRRVTLSNHSDKTRSLEITSYGEVILSDQIAHNMHPAFSKMFVESRFNSHYDSLMFSRAPRREGEEELHLFHGLVARACWQKMEWETDRSQFIGRGNTIHYPEVFNHRNPLSRSTGFTLDPIFSLRTHVQIEPGKSEWLAFVTGAAKSRGEMQGLMHRYYDLSMVSRTFEMAYASSDVQLRYERIPIHKIHLYQRLANLIFFRLPQNMSREAAVENKLQQRDLWRLGVSGDLPMVVAHIGGTNQLPLIQDLFASQHYLSQRGMSLDLVIVNEFQEGYRTDFRDELERLRAAFQSQTGGKIHLLNREHVTDQEMTLLIAEAHLTFTERHETMEERLDALGFKVKEEPERITKRPPAEVTLQRGEELLFFNGLGGFVKGGKGYRMLLPPNAQTPQPWCNVIGSERFGFLVTERGGGYTWAENSRENRLTPWANDPVSDPKGEIIYIRNRDTGAVLTPTPMHQHPNPGYQVEHRFGYSSFSCETEALRSHLTLSGSPSEKVKWWKLSLTNLSDQPQPLDLFLYVDWVLGVSREKSKGQLICEFDETSDILYAINHYNNAFSDRVAFIGSSEKLHGHSFSRTTLIGPNRDLTIPQALERSTEALLSEGAGIGGDGCGLIEVQVTLQPGEEKELLFFLGEEDSLEQARLAASGYRRKEQRENSFGEVDRFWKEITETVQVKTPEASFDTLMNGWLLYQTLSSRIFSRTAYYQSSGAFGFRDQLQDSMALLVAAPKIARKQILLHASRQFAEGDVQHWWHPPEGGGIRSRITDNYLWLPYVVAEYLKVTGEHNLLVEVVPFLEGEALKVFDKELYITPTVSERSSTLYEHCTLSLERALTQMSPRGLPLINGGDWNDGMNEVGSEGKGESIWLGWFLSDTLGRFAEVADLHGDHSRCKLYKSEAKKIAQAIEKHAWDGEWYQRATFDDGTSLGSKNRKECQIDSISQSWSVIAGKGQEAHRRTAMESVYKRLVDKENRIIRLLDPPFTKSSSPNPGYIKSYPPGVRENGGQYTHAASWVVMATAMLGKGRQAFELFQMLNPIEHTLSEKEWQIYQGEPYVVAADVYSQKPYAGKAGWTWYTGASGWLYRVGLEQLLGFKIRGDELEMAPCIPAEWKEFSIAYKRDGVTYEIEVKNPKGVESGIASIEVDGKKIRGHKIPLLSSSEGGEKRVNVTVVMG